MNVARFEKSVIPCIIDDVTTWHHQHGWLWNVVDQRTGDRVAVFFCTLLCGDGGILHFSVRPNEKLDGVFLRSAFRRGIQMVKPHFGVMYATIEQDKTGLIRVVERLGFRVVRDGGFYRDGKFVLLLKFNSECGRRNAE